MTNSRGHSPSLVVLAAGMARRYGGCKPLAPIGPHGEPVLDLLVSDAVRAGFGRIVLVLHPETGPAIRYHVEQCWPASVDVAYAEQRLPLGTVHAVLAAETAVGSDAAFGVCNADDVYGEVATGMLAKQLTTDAHEHVLVGFELRSTIATPDPVTRGICSVGPDGLLTSLDERRQVHADGDGGGFVSDDGREPVKLDGGLPASVNLWGFQPDIWDVFHTAMDGSGLDEQVLLARVAAGGEVPKAEVLLPEVISTMVADGAGLPVRVLPTDAQLIGVTHAADIPVVSAELARQVAWGIRPAILWSGVD
ncbi:MAG: NTP transferase domain-containing protein [Acidimicrobiales bacterium]|jgi:CTP:molybdopterin cytidylyltransferase MocA